MDGPNEPEASASSGPGQVALSQRNLSLSEDESLLDSTMDIGDEDLLFADIPDDDDDDLGSSSELSVSPFEQADFVVGSKQSNDSSKDTLPGDAGRSADLTGKSGESSLLQSTRSSGRLRKEKVPNQRKNLFPGRPRVTNRGRKFNMNLSSEPLVSFKSPSSATLADSLELDSQSKLSLDLLSNTDDGNSSEAINSALTTPDTSLDAISHSGSSFVQDDTAAATTAIHPNGACIGGIASDQKLTSAKNRKTVNYPGKIKGKLNSRKKAKLVEYRRKRGSKARNFKPFNSPTVTIANFPSTSGTNHSTQEVDSKQDDSNENKIILCNSKDYFVLTQDVCIMCGSLGQGDEGRLLSCSQCGQCYHPFCAGVTKITKIMLKKGWRCLECTVCEGCGKPTDESRLLLCDDCDISYHTYCLDPPLENVPQGTWKCQWCVVCIKCHSTTPGLGSQWQANYTLCGPCASQKNCSLCKENYLENDLIIQCGQCNRWLHSKCDSMLDEDECEIASCIGYTCLRCRPSDQLPPHIQATRNGTLRSLLNKKRSEDKIDSAISTGLGGKKPDATTTNDVPEVASTAVAVAATSAAEPVSAAASATAVATAAVSTAAMPLSEAVPLLNNANKLTKYHLMNGVYLSEHGFAVIKALAMEQPKKTRVKRKPNAGSEEQVDSHADENAEERANDLENMTKQNDEERKARQRRLRLEKLGIGGFSVKQRGGRLSCNNREDEDLNQDSLERSGTPEGDKPKRRRRITKRQKSQLQESFPSYMQEAFFGKGLLDTIQSSNSSHHRPAAVAAEVTVSDSESDDIELDSMQPLLGKNCSVIELSSAQLDQTSKSKSESDLNIFDDDNFQGSLDDLPAGQDFDLQLSPGDMEILMNDNLDMLINENLERNNGLDELTNGSKIDADGKDDMDILSSNFNFNDIDDESGLPQMDGKEVEDIFGEDLFLSDSSIQQPKDFPMSPAAPASSISNQQVAVPSLKPIVEPIMLPNLMQPTKVEMPASSHPPMPSVSGIPLSAESLASLPPKPFETNAAQQMAGPMTSQFGAMPVANAPPPQPHPTQENNQWQNNEGDNEASTQGQKNFLKWEVEEALGTMATISPVLYANLNFPNLKNDYPVWADRLKQISKLWRQLSSDQRQPFLQRARENRAANRIQKSHSDTVSKLNISMGKDLKSDAADQQKQWKELQSPHSNSAMMGEPSSTPNQCQLSSPANEAMSFSQVPEYGHQPPPQMYSPSHMHQQVKMQPSSPMLLNRPPPTPGSAALQSPMSPMMHSPRLRPTMQTGPFAENYSQQQQQQAAQPHQMNQLVRPSTMVSQGSFSPASPSLNQVHSIPPAECYHSSNPSTPQRPQSTDPQHSFGQATSPYGAPPRTPSSIMNPFSPGHHPQMQMHGSSMASDSNYGMPAHPAVSQANMDSSAQDMYKVNMTPQHQISKPHTPDSFGPSLPSSLPSTPQPPSSPQVPAPSPLNDIYARSPATPRSAPVNSQVRPPFEDSAAYQRQLQPDLYSPTNSSANFQQPYMQANAYSNMGGEGFVNSPAAAKAQMRPSMSPAIRANVPLRRTVSSDPYARQPMTPMPVSTSESHNPYSKPDDGTSDPAAKQQLRNLLQVHQMRRQETGTPQPRPPNWTDNGFRQPLSPAMTRNRMPIPSPNQYSMEQTFRYPADQQQQQRMMMQRGGGPPEMRFRQMAPMPQVNQQQQFPVRYPQMGQQMHSPGQQQHQPPQQLPQSQSPQIRPTQHHPQQQQQQWARMPLHSPSPSSSCADMSPMSSQSIAVGSPVPQSPANVPYSQHSQNYQQQVRGEMNAQQIQAKPETKSMEMNENKTLAGGDIGQLADDENLPVELGENDDLLELGDDFNILEYADDELTDKTLSGHSGKGNIFDELDEKDMLNDKEKEADPSSKANEKAKCDSTKAATTFAAMDNKSMHVRGGFGQGGFNAMNTAAGMRPTSSGQVFSGNSNKPNVSQSEQPMNRQEQAFFPSGDVLLSDDDFERLKMDFLNDPAESGGQIASTGQQQAPAPASNIPGQHSLPLAQPMQPQVPAQHPHPHHQHHQPVQQQTQPPGPPQPVQFHPQQQQHGPQFAQANQAGQPMWQDQTSPSIRPANFTNRMHMRMPMNQSAPIPRHLPPPPPQQALYGPTPNRIMMHHPQQQQQPAGHMHMSPGTMGGIRHPSMGANSPAPPAPPVDILNEQDRQMQVQYEQWLISKNNYITSNNKHIEAEMAKLRKMKKSLNAKQRQCRKNQNELSEHDSNELARVTAEIHALQKTLDQARKSLRQHNLLIQEYRQKYGSLALLPHSPGAPTVQTSPRSVNSPLAAMSTSGPGTPLGIGPSTPQSPSITSPSPSSLMQNSPISTLHSPASMMPPSPIHHSPMPPNAAGPDMGALRPQIVQDDNNPFSDVYLQKEKKHLQQSAVYPHQMASGEMADSRQQMYANYGEDGSVQQYYHSQPHAMPYQMNAMRPQSHAHYPPMSEAGNFPARFATAHGQPMNPQYANQQLNYQQIRRPPPPPYPGNPQQQQHFNARPPYQAGPQIRAQQMRSSPDCMPMRMQHQMYNEAGGNGGGSGMVPPEQFAMNQQVDPHGNLQHMPMGPMDSHSSMNPIVGEAKTTMEFNISELGAGHDNQSDPSSLVQDSEEKPQTQTQTQTQTQVQAQASSEDASHESNFADDATASTSEESAPLPSINIKREIDDTSSTSNPNNEEFDAAQGGGHYMSSDENPQYQDSFQSSAASNSANENSTDESAASKQEATRQNALLKQLLQNCPSADLNKSNEAQAPATPIIQPEKEIKYENVEKSSCQHAQQQQQGRQEASGLTVTNVQSDRLAAALESNVEMDVALGDSMSSQNLPCVNLENSGSNSPSTSAPQIEKKLTYLDIRRAQLERDPTPPPEEKPKRKRTVKRKESSKSIDDSLESTSNQSGGPPPATPKATKKRVRKGSQNRAEEPNSNDHYEHMLKSLIAQLRSLPSIPIVEPTIEPNLNICVPPDAPDLNSRETKLRGSFGNAFVSSTIDYYSTYPFGPNKASSVVPTIPPAALNSSNNGSGGNNRQFYNEEFGYMKNVVELDEHWREQSSKNNLYSLYARDTDSPESVVSSSSPECVLYDVMPSEYNTMRFINEDCDQLDLDRDCESPLLFMPLPIRPASLFGDLNEQEVDKENVHDDQKQRPLRLNGIPLKETGNVNITLMLPNELDIRNVIISLAKLLKVTQSITYNVEKSPTSKETDVVKFEDEDGESVAGRCKFCEEPLADKSETDSEETEFEREGFCSAACFENQALIGSLSKADKSGDSIGDEKDESIEDRASHSLATELQNEVEESEIISIFGSESSEFAKVALDLEGINIDEKRWKNTRYKYWNGASFKVEPKERPAEEEDEESIERALDKLAICLKPSQNAVEKRVCIFCHQLGDGEINGPSRLLNLDVDKWVHLNCALWSYEVYEMLNGALMNVDQAYLRAMNLGCARCQRVGASLKCFKIRCSNSYHFPCAIKEKCTFWKDKTIFCPLHSPKSSHPNPEEMTSFAVSRRVFINRDEQKQIAAMIHQGDNNLMRIGSLVFLSIGQLLPHQLQSFHTNSYIYPIGYKISRFYWSSRRLGKRCQYICSIGEHEGRPNFSIEIREEGYENVTYQGSSPKLVWQKVLEPIIKMREESQTIKVFSDFISGEDLFGLTEPAIIRILESLPGVDTLYDYNFKYGRSPWYELPLAINPTGCARTEPKMRTHFKRPHTLHVSSNTSSRSSLQSSLSTTSESTSPYVKQFVHSKISQYRKMKLEWRNNVYLARSRIQGLGLYAVRDIEKHTMIIEYIGLLIRNEIAERNERVHEAHNRGVYMFRLDDCRVIDATLSGGLARYVNHSCDPNCVAECVQIGNENKILIIANRRIQRGEEFTYDYKFEVEDDQHKIPCNCGAVNCRKWMN